MKQVDNARNMVKIKKKLRDAENTLFEEGKSQILLLNKAEEELFQARQKEMGSLYQLRQVLLQISVMEGSLLYQKKLKTNNENQ